MYQQLVDINRRPAPFSIYTAEELWTDPYTAEQMLRYHLDEQLPLASRAHAFIDSSVEWIAAKFDIEGKQVADFGCGPGLYTTRMAQRGARVTGIDFSGNSLDYARKQARQEGLEIDYRQANYLEFSSEKRFDLITMIMCDFCALSPGQRMKLLEVFRKHLAAGGRILLDTYTLAGYAAREEQASYAHKQLDGFWSFEDYFGFDNTFKYDDEKVVLDKYTIIEAARTRTIYNWLQYFSRESLQEECARSGFEVVEVLGDVAGSPYREDASEMAVILQPL